MFENLDNIDWKALDGVHPLKPIPELLHDILHGERESYYNLQEVVFGEMPHDINGELFVVLISSLWEIVLEDNDLASYYAITFLAEGFCRLRENGGFTPDVQLAFARIRHFPSEPFGDNPDAVLSRLTKDIDNDETSSKYLVSVTQCLSIATKYVSQTIPLIQKLLHQSQNTYVQEAALSALGRLTHALKMDLTDDFDHFFADGNRIEMQAIAAFWMTIRMKIDAPRDVVILALRYDWFHFYNKYLLPYLFPYYKYKEMDFDSLHNWYEQDYANYKYWNEDLQKLLRNHFHFLPNYRPASSSSRFGASNTTSRFSRQSDNKSGTPKPRFARRRESPNLFKEDGQKLPPLNIENIDRKFTASNTNDNVSSSIGFGTVKRSSTSRFGNPNNASTPSSSQEKKSPAQDEDLSKYNYLFTTTNFAKGANYVLNLKEDELPFRRVQRLIENLISLYCSSYASGYSNHRTANIWYLNDEFYRVKQQLEDNGYRIVLDMEATKADYLDFDTIIIHPGEPRE